MIRHDKELCVGHKGVYQERDMGETSRLLSSSGWGTMLKGLSNTIRQDKRTTLKLHELEVMAGLCDRYLALLPIKLGIVLRFFGYLRLSNLIPPTLGGFDKSRHTLWADVSASKAGLIIMLKWTKTLQSLKGSSPVALPALDNACICPVTTWNAYIQHLHKVESSNSTPLLLTTVSPRGQVITAAKFRSLFQGVVAEAGVGHRNLMPHSLRRGGLAQF